MNIKKKIGLNLATAIIGVTLFAGGTFAYFSDQEVTNNTFAAGTLDLSISPEAVINIENIKPGDSMVREFVLTNDGTLKIENVDLETTYSVIDADIQHNDDCVKHIR